jgi:hypothetical protein
MSLNSRSLRPYPTADVQLVDTSAPGAPSLPGGISIFERHKAESMTGVANGATASQWDDISGNGRHATQTNSAKRPTKRDADVGGKASFDFTPGLGYFDGVSAASLTSQAEGFFLMKADADPGVDGNGGLHFYGTASDNNHFPFSDGNIYDSFGLTSRITVGNPTPSLASWCLYHVSVNGGTWIARLNNSILITTGATIGFNSTPYIGNSRGLVSGVLTQFGFKGRIAEFLLLSAVSNSTQRTQIVTYFEQEYGLSLGGSGGSSGYTGQVAISWKNRNRLLGTTLKKQTAATETLETGQTTTVKIYKADGTTLLHTESGLTGTSYNYPASTEVAEAGSLQTGANCLVIHTFSVRDGLESNHVVKTVSR